MSEITTLSASGFASLFKRISFLERKALQQYEVGRETDSDEKEIRWARTISRTEDDPEYPTSGNEFWIELGYLDEENAFNFTPYDPQESRQARTISECFIEEGKVIPVFLSHGKWFIFDVSIGGRLGRTKEGGVPLGRAYMVQLYEPSPTGWDITDVEVPCWAFKSDVPEFVDVDIVHRHGRLVAYEVC